MALKINVLPNGHILQSPHYTYRIESVLGCGGFGITYLATANIKVGNVSLKGKFAIKEHFVSSDCEREPDSSRVVYSNPAKERVENSRKDFISEAKRLHKIGVSHPNIVKVNEVFEANNTAYYVMEYLEGESLRSFVNKNGGMKEDKLSSIMNPIIEAVQYLHENRMTHLDIKPDNIMLTQDDNGKVRPVLIDFGLSKHYDKNGMPTSTINTLGCSDGYAPIEQYAGITTFSPSADIYALGATMWFCLTGRNPKKSTDVDGSELSDSISYSSSDVRQLIEIACASNRGKRKIYTLQGGRHESSEPDLSEPKSDDMHSGTMPINIRREKDYCLFKINSVARKFICLMAVVLMIITLSNGWYHLNLIYFDIALIGVLVVYSLSIYGLFHPGRFVSSKKMKYIWTFGISLVLSCYWCMDFSFWGIFGSLCVLTIIISCYEFIVMSRPKYVQLGFILSVICCLITLFVLMDKM